jgi:hypothetical protein
VEHIEVCLSPEKYDAAVHGDGVTPTLRQGNDLAVYVKPAATTTGGAGVVITFTVELPDGSFARAQAVTTLRLFDALAAAVRGWRAAGLLPAE